MNLSAPKTVTIWDYNHNTYIAYSAGKVAGVEYDVALILDKDREPDARELDTISHAWKRLALRALDVA